MPSHSPDHNTGKSRGEYLERCGWLEELHCIVIRYTRAMATEITTDEYRALAELRYRIRHFLREGDAVAQAAGLEPQQYLLLLAIRGLPAGEEATIQTLAARLGPLPKTNLVGHDLPQA